MLWGKSVQRREDRAVGVQFEHLTGAYDKALIPAAGFDCGPVKIGAGQQQSGLRFGPITEAGKAVQVREALRRNPACHHRNEDRGKRRQNAWRTRGSSVADEKSFDVRRHCFSHESPGFGFLGSLLMEFIQDYRFKVKLVELAWQMKKARV
jgi:hypothetical protein